MEYSILPMLSDHWPAVREIYGQGIATGNATFEKELPDWWKWDSSHRKDCRLVGVETSDRQDVLGWAALSPAPAAMFTAASLRYRSTWARPPADAASERRFCRH